MAKKNRSNKLEQENTKLKREVAKLRKLSVSNFLTKLPKDLEPTIPTCNNCGNPDLLTIQISRKDKDFEIEVCNSCQHRSKLKVNK